MSVQYKANSVNVSENIDQNLLVYAHPGNIISFDFDISALDKEIVNGDLVIHLLNGKNITVVNFGLMALDNKSPVIEDINKTYNAFNLFGGEAYYEQDVGRYVISRVISSPDKLSAFEGEEYPSSKEVAEGEGVFSKQVGNFLTPEQSLVPEFAPLVQDYVSKTLQQANTKLYESNVNFTSKNQFLHNEIDSDIFPIKLLIINPKITPEYGTDYRYMNSMNPEHKGFKDLFVDIGGGRLKGDDFAQFMYSPYTVDLSKEINSFWFDGPTQTNKIIRYFHVGVPSQSVLFTKVVVNGLPSGVYVVSKANSNLDVKPLGSGTFEITVRGAAAGGVEIPIEYIVGMGGKDGVFASVGINYEAVQSRTGDLVRGNNTVYFEFKPVHGPDDVSNFSKFNTYTYSTLRDPLIIRFGIGDDVIKGGEGDYIYYGTAGDNKAYGGKATEVFHLGVGNNKFYAGLGNATVDVENLKADNGAYLSDAIDAADSNSVNTIVDNGGIVFTGKSNGVNFKSFIKHFANIYFDVGDKDKVTDRDDVVTVNSTWGMAINTTLHMGNGNNLVKSGSNAIVLDFKVYNGNTKTIFITTHNTSAGVFVKWGNGDNKVLGSSSNDTIIGYNDNESVSFDGNGGVNTANYNSVNINLTYDASTGSVSKESQSSLDKVVGIHKFIGGTAENTFYGSVFYTSFDGTVKQSNIEFINNGISDKSKLSYSRLKSVTAEDKKENGVKIDLSNNTVTKIKTGGVDRFHNINIIEASNNNDIFVISSDVKSSNLNGLGGFNTVDYSKSVVQVDFNISEVCSGTVTKGGGTHGVDVVNNFRHFIGSSLGSTFSLNDFKFDDKENPYRFIIEGGAEKSSNRVNYSTITGKAIVIDMKLNQPFLATLYTGKDSSSSVLGVDQLINIGVFGLSNEADNIIYMYSGEQLNCVLDGGANGNNLISLERSEKSVSLNFYSTNFSNINGFNYLKLSKNNDKIVMGAGFFGQEIDGNEGDNEIDFSVLSAPIVTVIDLENIEFSNINIGSKNIKVKNFSSIIATASDDVFNIKFDLVNANKLKGKNILFDGSQGVNIINFLKVSNSSNSSEGLIIDISDGVLSKVTDSSNNSILKFINFSHIVGSQGNDVFILPASAFDFTIDGGGGSLNTVSYQAYSQGIHISEEILSKFKNIHKIIGSQGNDTISLNESTSLHVDGFAGFNSASYVGNFSGSINIDFTDKNLSIAKGSKTDVLSHVEFIDFSAATVTGGVTINVKTLDNSKIATDKAIYLWGSLNANKISNDKIDYSGLSSGIILNLGIQTNLPAKGGWLSVDKGNGNIDYIQNIGRVLLSKNSQVNIYNSISALNYINKMEIDGGGVGILSFSKYDGSSFIDVSISTMKFSNTLEITFTGFNVFEGSGGYAYETTFLSSGDKSYKFNGLLSKSKLSYEKVVTDLDVVISNSGDKHYNELELKKSNNSDTAYNITYLRGSKGNTNVILNNDIYNDMIFEAEAGSKSKISYENIDNGSSVLVFSINKDGIIVGKSHGLYTDRIINFSNIVGGKGNSRFEVDTSILQSSVVYNIDGGGGLNTINFANFDANVIFKMEESGLIKVNLGQRDFGVISNMNYIFGTSTKNNNFVLGNFFNKVNSNLDNAEKVIFIYGNINKSSKDVLDLKDTKSNLALDPLSGKISLANNESISIVASLGIHTINLGDGDHQVDISSGVSASGWQVINGGSGKNNISFSKLLSGIRYDLSSGVKNLGFTLVNFTGVTGSKGNDIFELKSINENFKGMRIDGNGGTLNTLDYSDLNVAIKIDISSKLVLRGDIQDIISNIQIFKTGKGGAEIKVNDSGNYQFFGNEIAIDKNLLSYAGLDHDIMFNFTTKSIIKGSSNYDSFSNISKFIGGSNKNTFLFSTDALNVRVTEVLLDGGSGTSNIVNLSQLSSGIIYDIASKFFTVKYNGKDLKVKLENIHQVIGTSKADTFIFSDAVNNFNANGGVTDAKFKNTADFSRVSASVTVDFSNRTIIFGNNKNSFSNIDKFIGSKAGGNIFRGLSTNSSYEIDGGVSEFVNGGNTIEYSGASTGLALSVKDGSLHINKSGGLVDIFKNIHNLKLSNLSDEISFNSANDLNVYKLFKIIDGGFGDNLVTFNSNITSTTIEVDMHNGSIGIGSNNAGIKLVAFTSWKFANGSGKHIVTAADGNFNFRLVEFGSNNNSTINLQRITENLVISILEDGITSTVVGNTSGNRGHFINLKNLLLGSGVYSLNFVKFNPNSVGALNVKVSSGASMNLIIDQYVGKNAKIDISDRNIKLDTSNFSGISSASIKMSNTDQVDLTFRSSLVNNGNLNFYLDSSRVQGGTSIVKFYLESSISGNETDNIFINAKSNIILSSKDNAKCLNANIFSNYGYLFIKHDVTNLNISTFTDTSFKTIETLSTKVNLNFSMLPNTSPLIFYDINLTNKQDERMLQLKESANGNYAYTIKFSNKNIPNISITGSTNSDTFNFKFSDDSSKTLNIIENGSLSTINTINVNLVNQSASNPVRIGISKNVLSVGSINFNISGDRGINVFNFTSSNKVFENTNIKVSPEIKKVILPIPASRVGSGTDVIKFDEKYTGGDQGIYVNLNFHSAIMASGSINYGQGYDFAIENFMTSMSNGGSIIEFNVNSNTISSTREDTIVLTGFKNGLNTSRFLSIFFNATDYNKVNLTLDFSSWDIFSGVGFSFTLNEPSKKLYNLKFADTKGVFSFNGISKALFNVTDATNNSTKYKQVIELGSSISDVSGDNYFSFGNLNNMVLPTKYRILCARSHMDFPANSMYPEWTNGYSNSGKNNPRYYDTYNNVFIYTPYNTTISVDLNLNSNNESIFRNSSTVGSGKTTISGANLFWVGSSDREVTKVSVHEVSRAKPFALMLNNNPSNVIDFSNVKDGQDYLFRFIYTSAGRNDAQIVTITNQPAVPGTIPLDNSMNVYGSFAGARKLILTSSKNTMYIHGELTETNFTHIDGGKGLTVLSFAANLSQVRSVDFTRGEGLGFKVYRGANGNIPVDLLFTNVKVIENGHLRDFSGMNVYFNSNDSIRAGYESNFIVRQPKNLDGTNVDRPREIHFRDFNGKSNLYFNNKYILFTRLESGGNPTNFSVMAEDFCARSISGYNVNMVFGLKLNVDNLKSSTTINIIAQEKINVMLPEYGKKTNYTVTFNSSHTMIDFKITTSSGSVKHLILLGNKRFSNVLVPGKTNASLEDIDNITYINDYYDYLVSNPLFQLTEGDNAYKQYNNEIKPIQNMPVKYVMGANFWSNQFDFESNLTVSVVNEQYWKDIDNRIENAFLDYNKDKADKKSEVITYIYDEDGNLVNQYNDSQKDLYGNEDHIKEDNSNTNHSNIEEDTNIENNSEEVTENHSSIDDLNGFDLNSLLEAAKSITEENVNNNHSTVLDNLSIDLIPNEAIENTFMQDEANSMSYTVDTTNSAMSNFHSALDSITDSSATHEQQKNKLNY